MAGLSRWKSRQRKSGRSSRRKSTCDLQLAIGPGDDSEAIVAHLDAFQAVGVFTHWPRVPPRSLSTSHRFHRHLRRIQAKSAPDRNKYKVEANLPFDKPAACVLDMLYPREMKKNDPTANGGKKYPGVIMFHGGGWTRTSKSTMSTFFNRYLDHGFVVCNAEYRLADPTGQFTPEDTPAPAAVQDAADYAKWFWDHADEYNVDKSRLLS